MEKYNKYGESLYVDCNCKEKTETRKSNNCSCGGISLPSCDNKVEILINQLKREVKDLMQNTRTTDARKWLSIKHYGNPNSKLLGSQTYRGILIDSSNNSNVFVFTLNADGTVNYNCTVPLRSIYAINKN